MIGDLQHHVVEQQLREATSVAIDAFIARHAAHAGRITRVHASDVLIRMRCATCREEIELRVSR